jgi:hypothetical protein
MNKEKQIVRNWLKVFIAALFISGLTAIPVEQELTYVVSHFPFEGSIKGWLDEVLIGIQHTSKNYPFLFYGYDWLAFAHFVLAILFIGPFRDPVKNKWVIQFGDHCLHPDHSICINSRAFPWYAILVEAD